MDGNAAGAGAGPTVTLAPSNWVGNKAANSTRGRCGPRRYAARVTAQGGQERAVVDARVPDRLEEALVRLPLVSASTDAVLVLVPTVGRFLARRGAGVIEVERAFGATDADVACFARGPVAAAVTLLDGRLALRGSSVVVGGSAVVLCGAGAAGVSTLAAALALRGHAVLADRLVVIDPTDTTVVAGHGAVELWPDVVDHLGLVPDDGRAVRPELAKLAFPLGPEAPASAPVGAVISLSAGLLPGQAEVEMLAGHEKVTALLGGQWHGRLLAGLGLEARRFGWYAALGAAAQVAQIRRPRSRAAIDALSSLVARVEEVAT